MNDVSKYTFETALARLEEIVRALESGNADLDNSLQMFEEGVSLVKFCSDKLDSAEQLESVIDSAADENVLIDHLSRRLKVCGELEDRLRECRIISGGGDLAGELQQAIAGNFGGADYRLTIAELDEFLQRFVAVGHVPSDGRVAVFERFRSLYNRALVELQREEANESGITE